MLWVGRTLTLAVAGLVVVALPARADVTEARDNPYQSIIERNPFGLKPPAPPTTNTPPTTPTGPNIITLTGITSDSLSKRVWLMLPPVGTNAAQFFSLSEGERQGEIEVLEINEVDGAVAIRNAGVAAQLTFEKNGIKSSNKPLTPGAPAQPMAGVPPPPAPGMGLPAGPAQGGPVIVQRGGTLASTAAAVPQPNFNTFQTQPPGGSSAVPTAGVGAGFTTPSIQPTGTRSIPTRIPRIQPEVTAGGAVNVEAQYLMMQASQAAAQQRGVQLPPLPPLPGANTPQ